MSAAMAAAMTTTILLLGGGPKVEGNAIPWIKGSACEWEAKHQRFPSYPCAEEAGLILKAVREKTPMPKVRMIGETE